MARVAIILNTSWNIYNFRLPLLNALSKKGHEIVVIAPEDEYTGRIPYPFYHIPIKSRSLNPFANLLVLINFIKIFRKVRPDILLLYTIKPNIYGNFAAWLLGIKTISNIAGLGAVFIKQSIVTSLAKRLYRIALKIPDRVFFQNREDRDFFIREGMVEESKAEYIPGSGIDLTRFTPNATTRKKGNKENFVFLLFSRMLWDKGVDEFIKAAKLLLAERKGIEFKLLGFLDADNPKAITADDMTKLTAVEGIEYLGFTDEVENIISEADCVVLPSYREGVPKTLLEAAAMAKPIITTDVPGCRDVVEDGVNGFLCRPRDATDLYEKMKKMLDLEPEERQRMGSNGRKKVEREFDQQFVIEKYIQAVDRICSRGF